MTTSEGVTAAAERHRSELMVHCYQMVGSVHDAQDLVQETMIRAWRAAETFDPGRASMRTWLYRIATNVCLTALRTRKRRPLPAGAGHQFDDPDAPFVPGLDVPWLQPFPDRILAATADPADAAVTRSRLRLALVAAMQLLPPRQRAAVILRDVLGFSASEAAGILDTSVPSINSALLRARARLRQLDVAEGASATSTSEAEAVVDRYVEAFERADVAALTELLAEDVILEMPPMWNWYRGPDLFGRFMQRVFSARGTDWRTLRTGANGQPAFAAYAASNGVHELHTLQVFTITAGAVARATVFQDPSVFEIFQLESRVER